MSRTLRQDIPSRRARNALSQMAPGMADLNPAPGVGRTGLPPSGILDQAPAGSFQANRALNGEQGVAARQQARMRQRVSGISSSSQGSAQAPPAPDWDFDAFPADSDLFGANSTGPDRLDPSQRLSGDGRLSSGTSPHSTRFHQDSGLEGGGTGIPRGRGPVPPSSPESVGSDLSEWGGIDGEFRVLTHPTLGTPFELRPTQPAAPSPRPHFALPPQSQVPREAEQFRAASRSQSRQDHLVVDTSPDHEKAMRSHVVPVPVPRRLASQEDGGRATVRYRDHSRRRSRSAEPMEVDPGVGGRSSRSFAFPDPRTARYLDADPVGMLTSVHPVVVKVLADGWQEPIPLGHFARRFNPLISGHTPGDLSTLRMGENGQVQVHQRRLRDISLDELTETDWYQIKRNFPRAVTEFLIPPGQKHTGSEVALATADMLTRLFTLMEARDRFSKEITPIFYYVDHKIRWWRAHSIDNIRIDTLDSATFESIYREWKEGEDLKEKENLARDKASGRRGGFSGHGASSHSGYGGAGEGSSHSSYRGSFHHGSRGGRGFQDRGGGSRSFRCIVCGQPDHDSRRHQATSSDYLKRDSEGIYRDSAGKRVCFSWNGTKGCDFKPCQKGEHRCGICGSAQHTSQTHA
ncbi:hypothetical protein C8R42DRAFT_108418 [Lentinula raphanica]|nr:hypothetical protein C8R42DRAFT_108418 [Lentinula raphanica]